MQSNRLRPVGEAEPVNLIAPPAPPPAPSPSRQEQQLLSMLMLSLKALSQRTVVALASLTDAAMIASAFVMWLMVIEQPSTLQLVGVGGYALFILLVLYLRRRA